MPAYIPPFLNEIDVHPVFVPSTYIYISHLPSSYYKMASCPLCGSSNAVAVVEPSQLNTTLLEPSHSPYVPLKHLSETLLYGNQLNIGGHHGDPNSSNIKEAILDPKVQQPITTQWVQALTHTMNASNADLRRFRILVRIDTNGFKCETYYGEALILVVRQRGAEPVVRLLTFSERWRSEIERDDVLFKLRFEGEGGLIVG